MAATANVWVPGTGKITLSPAEHVATGGEGHLFIKGAHAYKLWLNPEKARASGLHEKLRALAAIRHPALVTPESVLEDGRHQAIGYRMPAIQAEPLVKAFASTWRDENGFGVPESATLARVMRETLSAAHSCSVLAVDANEMNWLFRGTNVWLIDSDSWQIGSWKATALMPSIRDWHSKEFSELTDWFAWAIVTFQLFTGIHPYKGTHPDFRRGDLEGRMRANASVFDSRVRLNSATRPLSEIPARLRDWYERVFQGGERSCPPDNFVTQLAGVATHQAVPVRLDAVLHESHTTTLPGPLQLLTRNGFALCRTASGMQILDLRTNRLVPPPDGVDAHGLTHKTAAIVRVQGRNVWTWLKDGHLHAQQIVGAGEPQPPALLAASRIPLAASGLEVYGEALHVLLPESDYGLQRMELTPLASRMVISAAAAWPILVRSSVFAGNVIVMDSLGTPFVAVPTDNGAMPVPAPELKDWRVLDGCASAGTVVLMAMHRKTARFAKLWLRKDTSQWALTREDACDTPDISAVVTARGVIVSADATGLVLGSLASFREIPDAFGGATPPRLLAWGGHIGYAKGNKLFRLTLGA